MGYGHNESFCSELCMCASLASASVHVRFLIASELVSEWIGSTYLDGGWELSYGTGLRKR